MNVILSENLLQETSAQYSRHFENDIRAVIPDPTCLGRVGARNVVPWSNELMQQNVTKISVLEKRIKKLSCFAVVGLVMAIALAIFVSYVAAIILTVGACVLIGRIALFDNPKLKPQLTEYGFQVVVRVQDALINGEHIDEPTPAIHHEYLRTEAKFKAICANPAAYNVYVDYTIQRRQANSSYDRLFLPRPPHPDVQEYFASLDLIVKRRAEYELPNAI